MKPLILVSLILLFLSSCSFQKSKNSQSEDSKAPAASGFTGFMAVKATVFENRCMGCHSSEGRKDGGVALDNFKNIKAQLSRVKARALDQKDMPPGGLSESEMQSLATWIDSGAPEKTIKVKNRKLMASVQWDSIKASVLSSCLDCHSQPKPEAGLDLSEYSVFKENKTKVIDRVIYGSACPLPPLPALTEDEKLDLMKWILRGMPK